MSLITDTWEATHQGHQVRVKRSNLTHGFELRIDGEKVGGKVITLLGIGEATGNYHLGNRDVPVKVELSIGSECNVWIDGTPIAMAKVG